MTVLRGSRRHRLPNKESEKRNFYRVEQVLCYKPTEEKRIRKQIIAEGSSGIGTGSTRNITDSVTEHSN